MANSFPWYIRWWFWAFPYKKIQYFNNHPLDKGKKGIYDVIVFREMYEDTLIEIEADNSVQARLLAYELLNQKKIKWNNALEESYVGVQKVHYRKKKD